MPKLSSLYPRGLFRFIGGRLVRSLITLVLFQLVLYALIQTLNQALPADMQALELAISAREDLSAFRTQSSSEQENLTDLENIPKDEMLSEVEMSSNMEISPNTEVLPEMEISPDMEISIDMEMSPDMEISPDVGVLPEVGLSPDVEIPSEIEITPELDISTEPILISDEQISPEPIPWWGEFVGWMTAFYRGDLGESISPGSTTPVIEILKVTLPRTLLLLIPGTIGGFLLGIWLGKIVAWRPRGWTEFTTTLGGTAFYTSFAPWLAFVMINVFGLYLDWFPPEKLIDPKKWFLVDISLNEVINRILITIILGGIAYLVVVWMTHHLTYRKSVRWRIIGGAAIIIIAAIPWVLTGIWHLALDLMNHLVLPLATLILLSFGETMLIMKTTMTEAVVAQHVTTARAKGLPDVRVRDRHAARVAILPVLTRFIVHLPFIVIGSFVVEHFFYWDGMGQELIRAANENDLPVLLGVLSVVAIGILIAHTILDILTSLLDPRLRKFRQAKAIEEVI